MACRPEADTDLVTATLLETDDVWSSLPPLTGSELLDPWRLRLRDQLAGRLTVPDRPGPTPSEKVMWAALQERDESWCREYATGPYRLDFYLPDVGLAVEVDGSSHRGTVGQARDAARDEWHHARGIETHRVGVDQVLRDVEGVLKGVLAAVERRRMARCVGVAISDHPASEVVPAAALGSDDVTDLAVAVQGAETEITRHVQACMTVLPTFSPRRFRLRLAR